MGYTNWPVPWREVVAPKTRLKAATATTREYFAGIWAARYFWAHLALADLRSRWRRSFFGILWSILQPLGTALLLAVVLSRLFHTNIRSYAPYVISGMIVWDFIMAVSTGGSLSFVQADAYIKHYRHPLAIYSLRTVLANLAVLVLASMPMFAWAAIAQPERIGVTWIAAISVYPVLLLICWPLVTVLAYIGSRFRDLPNLMTLLLQACWFVSPVYFETNMFRRAGLSILVDYNPVFHLLQVVRAPLLQGQWPSVEDYTFCMAMALFFSVLAWLVGRSAETKIIFFL
jgi:homopolymeric O-antigen transport system permease protein